MQNFLITRVSKQFRPRDVKDPAFFRELDELHIHASQELQARALAIDINPAQILSAGGGVDTILSQQTIKAGIFNYDPISTMRFVVMGTIANNGNGKTLKIKLNAVQIATHSYSASTVNPWCVDCHIFNYGKAQQKCVTLFTEHSRPTEVTFTNTTEQLYDQDFLLSLFSNVPTAGDIVQEVAWGMLLRKEAGS